eukprot:CAMPEP_0172750950 /NCGR_PEP_ID=MMETSP1074-20121228/150601_1 /TAXON_ID=2916 /ORGANISM="Ceratium fusus, Strain PA161109" /LENGTH=52 /DNA_ID=CAMNT_0013583169 /DNA_START=97 /DNA_END=255 /DNA_ORIENTATION=+
MPDATAAISFETPAQSQANRAASAAAATSFNPPGAGYEGRKSTPKGANNCRR